MATPEDKIRDLKAQIVTYEAELDAATTEFANSASSKEDKKVYVVLITAIYKEIIAIYNQITECKKTQGESNYPPHACQFNIAALKLILYLLARPSSLLISPHITSHLSSRLSSPLSSPLSPHAFAFFCNIILPIFFTRTVVASFQPVQPGWRGMPYVYTYSTPAPKYFSSLLRPLSSLSSEQEF
jgi:hypothetical protein